MSGSAVGKVQSEKPNAATVEAVTQIWQRVLHRSPIGPEERFHDLGGTDPLADQVFAEIEQRFHRQLPSATICHAPTIAALAALLGQPALPRFFAFVPLKAGSANPPILIAHGVGGRASFSELARHIRTENPVYGIQARGVDGLEEPLRRIEDMAEHYLDELAQLQPQGPYILIGYSFGGLIALEMAQRLSAAGKRIALLALVDTYPDPRFLPPGERLRLAAKRIKGHFADLAKRSPGGAVADILAALNRRWRRAHAENIPPQNEATRLSFAETTAWVKQSDFQAMRLYRPRFYRGKIKFVRPETNSYLPTDPETVWKNLAAQLEVETVPGDHLGMIGTHFETLAAVLTRYVKEAAAE